MLTSSQVLDRLQVASGELGGACAILLEDGSRMSRGSDRDSYIIKQATDARDLYPMSCHTGSHKARADAEETYLSI